MADVSGMTIGLDLPSYAELATMNHNAERRERAAKRRIAKVRAALKETKGASHARWVREAVTKALH